MMNSTYTNLYSNKKNQLFFGIVHNRTFFGGSSTNLEVEIFYFYFSEFEVMVVSKLQ